MEILNFGNGPVGVHWESCLKNDFVFLNLGKKRKEEKTINMFGTISKVSETQNKKSFF